MGNDSLFDMRNDPGQKENIIGRHPELVKKMRAAYDEWWESTRPLMVNENAPMSKTKPFHELYKRQMQTKGVPDWEPSFR